MGKVLIGAIVLRVRRWARRRQGADTSPVTLGRRRIYILPTRFGVLYACVVFAMLLASMNYNNSLGFALSFLLTGLGLVAMHHCHRNLSDLIVTGTFHGEAFAGGTLRLQVGLENASALPRFELSIECQEQNTTAVSHSLDPQWQALATFELWVYRRGVFRIDRITLSTRFPFGLFRAWSWLHLPLETVVYPEPAGIEAPPQAIGTSHTEYDSRRARREGIDDFRGFRSYVQGDSPRHIHWKALARGSPLLVKEYAAATQAPAIFDFDEIQTRDVEERLSQLCRWIADAERNGSVYGLKLPGQQIPLGSGAAHRRRCLTALALFQT